MWRPCLVGATRGTHGVGRADFTDAELLTPKFKDNLHADIFARNMQGTQVLNPSCFSV